MWNEGSRKNERNEPKAMEMKREKRTTNQTGVWIFIGRFLCFTYKNPVYEVVLQSSLLLSFLLLRN